ncbi:MaoC family dehydratase [Natronosporangium hydrolyticum]|uniref:MaoC family dehydratase n=1 Tax=Natronosporangium hydrolyticum TaxID=2811111 RepID=A0A895YRH2_9ACTN|nr:MaoC family dehydratase [Natronosporangium hydrolyticum]QSB16618.1 MaoC family dehydratase [Natronosporangium hydrolyticum]
MAEPRVVEGADGLRALIGEQLGYTDWLPVAQDQVDRFADATGDHQWIHVDQERAKTGPFGQTVAHGFLTLSLIPTVLPQLLDVRGFSMGVNYGLDRVRFPAPVPVGSRLRATAVIEAVDEQGGGVQTTLTVTFEIEGGAKPACVARFLERRYP